MAIACNYLNREGSERRFHRNRLNSWGLSGEIFGAIEEPDFSPVALERFGRRPLDRCVFVCVALRADVLGHETSIVRY